jgi:diguanylate cyclase (GGDEF)-like protein
MSGSFRAALLPTSAPEVPVELQEPRETAGTTTRLIIDHVRRHGGEPAVQRLLAEAGETRPLSVLEDEGNWMSYDAKIRLFEAAARVTGQADVARRVGEGALASSVGGSLKLLIGLVGSPAQVARGIARANSKFSTAADMTALTTGPTSAIIRYRVHDRYRPSFHDCEYTLGLLTQIPVLFGQPPATVQHDVCQVRGADACLYALTWDRRRRARRGRRGLRQQVVGSSSTVVLQRLHDLQETVADLVADRDVEEVLAAVTARARSTVGAQRFLLAARLDEGPPRIHADGFTVTEAEETASALLRDVVPSTGEHVIVAPVRSAVRDYGVLAAFGQVAFFEHEQDLLSSYAALAATALDTVTALEEVRDGRLLAEALLGFARAVLETRTLPEVAGAAAVAALAVAEADNASIMLLDQQHGVLRMAGHAGFTEEHGGILHGLVVRRDDTVEMADLVAHPQDPRQYEPETADPFLRGILEAFGIARMIIVPLWSGSRLWGIINLGWTQRTVTMTSRLLERVSGLADQAVTALDRVELAEQVHRQATVDPLTGLANRRAFTDALQRSLAGEDGDPEGAAVVFLDLDRFKAVNDTLGHGAGDELLCTVARRLRDMVRAEDLVARLGGDEFTVLLRSVDGVDELREVTGRICATLGEPVVLDGEKVVAPPSVGAVMLDAYTSVRDVLRDADAAMYAAKSAGGARHVVAGPQSGR